MHSNGVIVLGFFLIYTLLLGYLRSVCWRDPTSFFYRTHSAHIPAYSTYRIQQATEYVESVGDDLVNAEPRRQKVRANPPELCIGIPTVQRHGISYLKSTLGSLQHGLTPQERNALYFVVFIAHTNQSKHEEYNQPWLVTMADELPSYDNLTLAQTMSSRSHEIKSKYDYSIVLEACANTGAPYLLMLEDDVLFLDGWWPRVARALDLAAIKTWEAGHIDFLYLRLFYYEGLLGWNRESWPLYLSLSLVVTTAILSVLLITRRYLVASRRYITRFSLCFVALVATPLFIILYFASGGNCVSPRPAGVNLMPDHACCGQGLVFTRSKVVNELLPLFRSNRWSEVPTDSFIEVHADVTLGLRWALTPVVMQHIGGQSSHGVVGTGDLVAPKEIWNFRFEENDPVFLADERSQADDN
ncbi:hypothetical protein EV127DRAFT_457700 [Xylaria flabelliformis]|nr:hypothetical protein EV127DRAFT_457700 [Xylaria flabelliformis]